jgi:alkane 1-monooxygenase
MPPAVARAQPMPESARETLRVWALHLLCFVLPVASLAFLATAPHSWWGALPWMLVLIGSVVADVVSGPERRQPAASLPGWPFDAVLYVLVAMQFVIIALLVRMVAVYGFWRVDTAVAFFLIGVNSGYSAIVVAHELIHRPARHMELLGRALLCTVLYEHFSTEHVRGHHVRVGTPEDPATARFGETGIAFLLRTVPGQFRSAWRLEAKRLGDENMRRWDPRLLRSRVVHGLVVEWALALGILGVAGPGAFAIFLLQAMTAVRLLEAVNYFEHWGLVRRGRKVAPIDSWDTDSSFTLYTLVGLSRHADHHAHASRPYPQLRWFDESPKLPTGYFGTVLLLIVANARFRQLMTAELRRRRLGPFAPAGA